MRVSLREPDVAPSVVMETSPARATESERKGLLGHDSGRWIAGSLFRPQFDTGVNLSLLLFLLPHSSWCVLDDFFVAGIT